MGDQNVKYTINLQDLGVVSGLRSAETQANRTESAIEGINSTARSLAATFGIAFGIREMVSFSKDALETAATYEQAMQRIKFASSNAVEGLKNQQFILGEVGKFKIPLQEATEAYGKFLSMIGSTGMAGDKIRSLHDDLLMTAKIKGISDAQMNTAVMDLGKMLESGQVDNRHLRGFGYQLNGIMPYIARELHESTAKLAQDLHHGKAVNIDPNAVLTAIHKQAEDVSKNLPEALKSMRSELNEVGNAWTIFKKDIGNSPEFRNLLDTVKDITLWLGGHVDDVMRYGKAIMHIVEAFAAYKIALGAIRISELAWMTLRNAFGFQESNRIGLIKSETLAVSELTAAVERLVYVQATQANMPTLASMSAANAANLSGIAGVGVTKTAAGLASGLSTITLAAATIYIAGSVVLDYVNRPVQGKPSDGLDEGSFSWGDLLGSNVFTTNASDIKKANEQLSNSQRIIAGDPNWQSNQPGRIYTPEEWEIAKRKGEVGATTSAYSITAPTKPGQNGLQPGSGIGGHTPKTDLNKVRGNTVTIIKINIQALQKGDIVIKSATVREGAGEIKRILTDTLTSAVNDSQIMAHH